MLLSKAIRKVFLFSTVIGLLSGFISCRQLHTRCTDRDVYCSSCEQVQGYREQYCYCQRDTTVHCAANMVHASYNYQTCNCKCDYGWTGANCDQLDSSIYISFKHGSDTLALSNLLTADYVLRIEYWGRELTAYFPASGDIDSVRFGNFPGHVGTVPFCGGRCAYMEIYFSNGQKAFTVSGNLTTVDSGVIGFMRKGTFNADLYTVGTGDTYYVRDGVINLPF